MILFPTGRRIVVADCRGNIPYKSSLGGSGGGGIVGKSLTNIPEPDSIEAITGGAEITSSNEGRSGGSSGGCASSTRSKIMSNFSSSFSLVVSVDMNFHCDSFVVFSKC